MRFVTKMMLVPYDKETESCINRTKDDTNETILTNKKLPTEERLLLNRQERSQIARRNEEKTKNNDFKTTSTPKTVTEESSEVRPSYIEEDETAKRAQQPTTPTQSYRTFIDQPENSEFKYDGDDEVEIRPRDGDDLVGIEQESRRKRKRVTKEQPRPAELSMHASTTTPVFAAKKKLERSSVFTSDTFSRNELDPKFSLIGKYNYKYETPASTTVTRWASFPPKK